MSDDSEYSVDDFMPDFEHYDGHGCCFDVIVPIKHGGSQFRGWDENKLIYKKLALARQLCTCLVY